MLLDAHFLSQSSCLKVGILRKHVGFFSCVLCQGPGPFNPGARGGLWLCPRSCSGVSGGLAQAQTHLKSTHQAGSFQLPVAPVHKLGRKEEGAALIGVIRRRSVHQNQCFICNSCSFLEAVDVPALDHLSFFTVHLDIS